MWIDPNGRIVISSIDLEAMKAEGFTDYDSLIKEIRRRDELMRGLMYVREPKKSFWASVKSYFKE
jgi:hypothetical protein